MTDDRIVGTCVGCGQNILSGSGVTVDAENGRWHPECRAASRRQAPAAVDGAEPKRRGRPPKQPVA